MAVDYLDSITIRFPASEHALLQKLSELLRFTVIRAGDELAVKPSNPNYIPKISLNSSSEEVFTKAEFSLSTNEAIVVYVKDITDKDIRHSLVYRHLTIEEIVNRFIENEIEIKGIDHLGINLPWFAGGLHPAIADLRNRLKPHCLYHQFPTGELWDFIIPGEMAEIQQHRIIDYGKTRKPKFEIVSFDKCSIPLVQIDIAVADKYECFSKVFPEALNDPVMKNIWIYIESSHDMDICLVMNQQVKNDWSAFFKGHRLI